MFDVRLDDLLQIQILHVIQENLLFERKHMRAAEYGNHPLVLQETREDIAFVAGRKLLSI